MNWKQNCLTFIDYFKIMKKDVIDKLDIYKLKTSEELLKYYRGWTNKNKYNKDMVDWNYTAPQETVSVLKKYALNKDCKILDARELIRPSVW